MPESYIQSGGSADTAATSADAATSTDRTQCADALRAMDQDAVSLWQVDIYLADGYPDRRADELKQQAQDLRLPVDFDVRVARGFLLQGKLTQTLVDVICTDLLVEPVVEHAVAAPVGDQLLLADANQPQNEVAQLVHVLPKAGVTDTEAESALDAIRQLGIPVEAVRTLRKYWISNLSETDLAVLCSRVLANDAVEQVHRGALALERLQMGGDYNFELKEVPLRAASDAELQDISRQRQLSLTLVEMRTIQQHFQELERDPTDVELETLAQTWSEHCSHKTLAGRISYRDENGERHFENMLKETIFAATQQIRSDLGQDDWCVSVFQDNAGIVQFDEGHNVAFKVETHNRPSALEPYGGANTGIGGVIRDTLGTGLGAKPICSTDVFCFAPPDIAYDQLPPGVIHPRRIMQSVVAGVRDYGNRMGIPTVNGAIYFDDRYVGNPLVFCGNVGILPADKSFKQPHPNDLIVSVGGRTGRDGIHGATFSSAELTETSESTSGGAVQIGNAITEKMVMDVLLQARDRGLYNAVTDCGAGGYSSAVGEMGENIGAEVWLDQVPLKYAGLSYTEIWISEAQERMVLAVPESKWPELQQLCQSESVEATVIGRFKPGGKLLLQYDGRQVAQLSMEFMHHGRPPVVREAVFQPPPQQSIDIDEGQLVREQLTSALLKILGSPNVASKHWVVRQYDHEVQGGSVIKPLVGVNNDGPSDASVIRPILDSYRGLAVACGMNPHYGDYDPYHMAANSIDEAIRNCVAVGADPARIAILDNFCWGYTDRPETLGALVRAALACYDVSVVYQTPFISGKDSLNNEFSYTDRRGEQRTISIPPTLLVSALGQIADVRRCVTMDFKDVGNLVFQLGITGNHLGGSHWSLVGDVRGGQVPTVDANYSRYLFERLHRAIQSGLVRSVHDMSEGGLAVCAAEMALAGELGVDIDVSPIKVDGDSGSTATRNLARLFSESSGRFLCEVTADSQSAFEQLIGNDCQLIGQTTAGPQFAIRDGSTSLIETEIAGIKSAWRQPFDWS